MWMMRGPSGDVAPFYGVAFTRKNLMEHLAISRLTAPGCKPVRVTVEYPRAKP